MDVIDFNNPMSASYNDNIIMEKIGIRDSTYRESDSMNNAIQLALLQQELETNKRKMAELEKNKQPRREHFTGGECGCASEGMCSKKTKCGCTDSSINFDNKKILLILVVVMVAFCVMQYFSYKNEMKEMLMLVCTMIKQNTQPVNGQQQQLP